MKWLNKFRSPLPWGLLLLMVALLGFPLSHAQAAGSITPPSATAKPVTAGPNMLTPDGSIGSQGHYRNYLNWQSATAPQSAATQYAVLTPGQSVNTYVSFYKGGWAGNNFRTALAIGSGSASISSQYGGTTQAGGNQTNVTAITGSSGDENNIGYKLTAPSVTQPLGCIFRCNTAEPTSSELVIGWVPQFSPYWYCHRTSTSRRLPLRCSRLVPVRR